MKKTIFYIPSNTEEGDYWFDNKPFKILLEMNDLLYEPNGNIIKEIIVDGFVKRLVVTHVGDKFSSEGIIRRIAFYKS